MMKTLATAAILGAASFALAGTADAQGGMAARGADAQGQFYATPIQKGAPTDLPGERLVPGASQTAMLMDTFIGPLATGIQGVGNGLAMPTAAEAPAAAPMMHHRRHMMMHHHHMMMHHHHMMMHKKMMKKEM